MKHVQKETAILLKEKGFDLPCLTWYTLEEDIMRSTTDYEFDANGRLPNSFTAPELYKVPIWLRETKGVHVVALPVNLWQQWRMFIYLDTYPPQKTRIPDKPMDFKTHDLALEASIVHALKYYVK